MPDEAGQVPGVVDVTLEDRPAEIRAAAADPELDRGYRQSGPPLNRLHVNDVLSTLRLDGQAFPTLQPRDDQTRADARDELWTRLNQLASRLRNGPAELDALAEFVQGSGSGDHVGPLVEQVVGKSGLPHGVAAAHDRRDLTTARLSFHLSRGVEHPDSSKSPTRASGRPLCSTPVAMMIVRPASAVPSSNSISFACGLGRSLAA